MAVRCSLRGEGSLRRRKPPPWMGRGLPPWASEMGPHHSVHSLARRGGRCA